MDKEKIIDYVEKLINEEIDDWNFEKDENDDVVQSFLGNAVIRLLNTYKKYRDGEGGLSDYICAIRSFMLSFQTELRIEESGILAENHFGIYYNISSHKYYATYDVPQYIEHKEFVENAFVNANTEVAQSGTPYNLHTNKYIYTLTGFDRFKSMEQKLCIYGALNTPLSYTTLISMPTGGGKSLVTQALGYEKRGLTIVIVPTVSLAIDQERAAKKNIKIANDNEIFCYYSGTKNFSLISDAIKNQTARLLFISPEALIKNESFKELIRQANELRFIKNLVIDEAHIVVAWGDFFRIDYQCLGPWRRGLLKVNPDIRTYLLSATFKDDTVNILKRMFSDDEKWLEIRCDSLRKEPKFVLVKADCYKDKKMKVLNLVNLMPKPMILYVNSPYEANKWQEYLKNYRYYNVKTFTGETKSEERQNLISKWSDNQYEIMIATSAFGVGVDKPDIRSVIHLYVPESPDSYYQELGRGGRDGLQCLSIMCIEDADVTEAFNHVSKVLTTEKLWGRWWSMYKNPAGMWSGGEIPIFASTKPNYRRINFFEEGNETDEKWNINVLLLLNRYELIKISSIELDVNNRYIFTIRILNEQITAETDATKRLFDIIREKESAKFMAAFSLIRSAIEKADRACWSSMFYDTYPLVSEYCPGCNQHRNVVFDELNRFPLLVDIAGPEKGISDDVNKFFSNTNEALLISKNLRGNLINQYHPDVVITENASGYNEEISPKLIYMNYQELRALQKHDRGFYISGLIMAIYSDDPEKAIEEYQTMRKYIKNRNKNKVIHVTGKDFCISKLSGKLISSDIDGQVIS